MQDPRDTEFPASVLRQFHILLFLLQPNMASRNRITAGPKSVICHETDLRGEISIGMPLPWFSLKSVVLNVAVVVGAGWHKLLSW